MSTLSVIVPVYNAEPYLAACLESIVAQTPAPDEVLVIDDGSSDGSVDIARRFAADHPTLRSVAEEHAGGAAALNRGLGLAKGELLAFLDADDLWLAGKSELQLAALMAHPEVEMVFGLTEVFISPELTPEEQARLVCPEGPQLFRATGSIMLRTAAARRLGLFDMTLRTGWFLDWHMRAVDLGMRELVLPELVLRRRLHTTNLGLREKDARGDYLRLLKRGLDRRRGQA